jgi:hypothetical protein
LVPAAERRASAALLKGRYRDHPEELARAD